MGHNIEDKSGQVRTGQEKAEEKYEELNMQDYLLEGNLNTTILKLAGKMEI